MAIDEPPHLPATGLRGVAVLACAPGERHELGPGDALIVPAGADFSLSGLKTAVRQEIIRIGTPTDQDKKDLAASFQAAIVDVIVDHIETLRARAEAVAAVADPEHRPEDTLLQQRGIERTDRILPVDRGGVERQQARAERAGRGEQGLDV